MELVSAWPSTTHRGSTPSDHDTSVDSLLLSSVRQWLTMKESAAARAPAGRSATAHARVVPRPRPVSEEPEYAPRHALPQRHRRPPPRLTGRLALLTRELVDLLPSRHPDDAYAGRHRAF